MDILNNYLEVAVKSAREAGAYLLEHFNEKRNPIYKSKFDVSLPVDKGSEKIILKNIQASFPSHNIYSEEIGSINYEGVFTWHIDPLDGTNNYFVGIPYFSVSIALLQNGQPIVGVVYNPISNQLFTAAKSKGAFLNGEAIIRRKKNNEIYSVLSFIRGHSNSGKNTEEILADEIEQILSGKFSRVLKMWAPSLDWCLLALGRIDALVSYESEFEDMFAGLLIAQEAGVDVCNFNGKSYNRGDRKIIASNEYFTNDVIELLDPYSK